jgi:hypothetical protein
MDKWYKTKFNGTNWEAWGTPPKGSWAHSDNTDCKTEQDAIKDLFYTVRENARDAALMEMEF